MRTLLLCCLLSSIPLSAQSPPSSPPLTDGEKREVLNQLFELRSCREEVRTYEQFVTQEAAQAEREQQVNEKALEVERQAAELARRERDLAIERAALYEQLYKSLAKKPGIGCRILRVITIGIVRCQ